MSAKSVPHKRASRKTISCENCRARKVRCSRESPCSHCVKRGEDCIWKADAHPIARQVEGHTYSETDATILHKTIDALASRLMLGHEEVDSLIKSFAVHSSPSPHHLSHTDSEGSDSPDSFPGLTTSFGDSLISSEVRSDRLSASPSSFSKSLPSPSTPSWSAAEAQPAFTVPTSLSNAKRLPAANLYQPPSDTWVSRGPAQLAQEPPLFVTDYAPPESILPSTPSMYQSFSSYFDTANSAQTPTFSPGLEGSSSQSMDLASLNAWLSSTFGGNQRNAAAYSNFPGTASLVPTQLSF